MAVGNQAGVSVGNLNSQLGNAAVSIRDASAQIGKLWSFVSGLGADQAAQTAALAAIGFTAPDAAAFWTDANRLFAVSQLYLGQITQATAFNYDSSLALARGAS